MASSSTSAGEGAVDTVFIPRLRVTLPSGWFAKESITITDPDGAANVIASTEPLDPAIDSHQYAERQGRILHAEFRGYHELEFRPDLVFGGRPGYLRTFRWHPDKGEPVHQIQIYYAAAGRGLTGTATTPSSRFEDTEALLRKALATIALETPASD